MNVFGGLALTPTPRPLGSRHDRFTEAPAGARPIPSQAGCRVAAGWVSPGPPPRLRPLTLPPPGSAAILATCGLQARTPKGGERRATQHRDVL